MIDKIKSFFFWLGTIFIKLFQFFNKEVETDSKNEVKTLLTTTSTVYLPLIMNNYESEESEVELKPIVDISYWQQGIDYDKFAASISGVILRGVYGIWKDTMFEKHYEEFHKRGIPIGCYHYIIGNYTGKKQAEVFYDAIKNKELKLGIWNDVEDQRETTALNSTVVIEYQTEVERLTGRKMGIYTGVYAWYAIMGSKSTMYSDRKLWIAHYGVTTPSLPRYSGWKKWVFWQYSSSGRIDGYSSNIDMNHYNGTEEEYRKEFSLDGIVEPPVDPNPELPVDPPIEEVILPILKVMQKVNVRPYPNVNNTETRTRQIGEIVKVEEIKIHTIENIWVRDKEGWSAVVYYTKLYMG